MHDARDAEDSRLLEAGEYTLLAESYYGVVLDRCRARVRPEADAIGAAAEVAIRLLSELKRGTATTPTAWPCNHCGICGVTTSATSGSRTNTTLSSSPGSGAGMWNSSPTTSEPRVTVDRVRGLAVVKTIGVVARLGRAGVAAVASVPRLDWRRVRPHPLRWLGEAPLDRRLAPYSALGDYLSRKSDLREPF